MHFKVRQTLSRQHGVDLDNIGVAEWSAPQITLMEPTIVEREYGEEFSAVWVQYVRIDPTRFNSKGLEDPLRPSRHVDKSKGVWDEFQVEGETLRSRLDDMRIFAYCLEDMRDMLVQDQFDEWNKIDYQIIQQHMHELLKFVGQPRSAEYDVIGVSHDAPSLTVLESSDCQHWDEIVSRVKPAYEKRVAALK